MTNKISGYRRRGQGATLAGWGSSSAAVSPPPPEPVCVQSFASRAWACAISAGFAGGLVVGLLSRRTNTTSQRGH